MSNQADADLSPAQIRAARALLGWSQAELINRSKCGRSTLIDLENGYRKPHSATLHVIRNTLIDAGINFTDRGVEFRDWPAAQVAA